MSKSKSNSIPKPELIEIEIEVTGVTSAHNTNYTNQNSIPSPIFNNHDVEFKLVDIAYAMEKSRKDRKIKVPNAPKKTNRFIAPHFRRLPIYRRLNFDSI